MNKKILYFLLVSVFSLGSVFAAGANSGCNYGFATNTSKIVLPQGYYENYILGDSQESFKYHAFSLKTDKIDHGYVYCVGLNTGSETQCIDDVSNLIDTDKIMFVTINNKNKTYFFFKQPSDEIDFIIPLSKKFVSNSNIELSIMRYFEGKPEGICSNQANNLNIALKPFEVAYNLVENINVDNSQKTAMQASLEVINPDGVNIIVSDIEGKSHKIVSDTKSTHPLSVSSEHKGGFCLSYKSYSDDTTLKQGIDYFCKKFEFSKEGDDALQNYWKNDLSDKKYIQIDKSDSEGIIPHMAIGSKKTAALIKAGYMPKTIKGKKGSYVVVGPFAEKELEEQLKAVQAIEKKATVF